MPGGSGRRLLLVGCGKMGAAMLNGWLAGGFEAADIRVVEPQENAPKLVHGQPIPRFVADAAALDEGFDPAVVVFALKPQILDQAAPLYRAYAGQGAVFLSIAAGKTIGFFEGALGQDAAIVRSMPNTPAAIGRGMTVACANPNVGPPQRALCDELLCAVGEVAWIEEEGLLDAVTAVSGSGPAYVFLLAEALAEAGLAAGLPQGLAARLARATVTGAGELLHRSSQTPDILRRNVTSPGGTTQAALDVLMAGDGLAPLMARAVAAAARRSRELAG
ncbi:MAG: pyrroline-5-carboxylate reductase [Alphaproteobacteria bacterium]